MHLAQDEISHWMEFDYALVNEDFDQAVASVRGVLRSARLATGRQTGLGAFISRL